VFGDLAGIMDRASRGVPRPRDPVACWPVVLWHMSLVTAVPRVRGRRSGSGLDPPNALSDLCHIETEQVAAGKVHLVIGNGQLVGDSEVSSQAC